MKKPSSKFLIWTTSMVFVGFVSLGTSSCSPKYGCPAVEQTDISKGKSQKSSSGLFGDDFGKPKKKKKNKK